jgi:hypothetical protein
MAREILRLRRLLATLLCVLGLIPLMGCRSGPRRASVSGTVTLDGKPVKEGLVSFSPDASKGNTARVSCTALIKDGSYELKTTGVLNSEKGSGAPLGWYKVSIQTVNNFKGQPKNEIPNKYTNPEQTPLSIEVVDNPEPGHYDIKLDS